MMTLKSLTQLGRIAVMLILPIWACTPQQKAKGKLMVQETSSDHFLFATNRSEASDCFFKAVAPDEWFHRWMDMADVSEQKMHDRPIIEDYYRELITLGGLDHKAGGEIVLLVGIDRNGYAVAARHLGHSTAQLESSQINEILTIVLRSRYAADTTAPCIETGRVIIDLEKLMQRYR